MLDPAPRDFTSAATLDRAQILKALRNGIPGTAMKPFAGVLAPDEIEAVTAFVLRRFVTCGARNSNYHTDTNGWPDHRARYGPAIPFATGELAIDTPAPMMDAGAAQGLELFRSACISCHEGRLSNPERLGLQVAATELAASDVSAGGTAIEEADHDDEYDRPTIHDFPPVIPDLRDTEVAGLGLYMSACVACHAADGSGQNWIGSFLEPSPTDFTTEEFAARFDEEWFVSNTLDGPVGTTMPSFRNVLSEQEAAAIAAYVRRAFVEVSGPK